MEFLRLPDPRRGIDAACQIIDIDQLSHVMTFQLVLPDFIAGPFEGFLLSFQSAKIVLHDSHIRRCLILCKSAMTHHASGKLDDRAIGGGLDHRPVKVMVSAGFFDRRSHDEEKDISLPALIDMTANDRVCQLRALPFFSLAGQYAVQIFFLFMTQEKDLPAVVGHQPHRYVLAPCTSEQVL